MKLLLLASSLCVFVQSARASTDDAELPASCSRFEYEYKILGKLTQLAQEMDNLRKASFNQADELNQLRKANKEKSETIQELTLELKTIEERLNATDGSVYIRWGRTVCPNNGTELVYKGYAGGSHYSHSGGAANYICLPETPTYGRSNPATSSTGALVYGAEYETNYVNFLSHVHDDDATCAVCRSIRPTSLMIPGRNKCTDSSWTLEYAGYLAAGHYSHVGASEFVCLDSEPTGKNDTGSLNGKLFYIAETRTGSLPSPPYINGADLSCVVCTK